MRYFYWCSFLTYLFHVFTLPSLFRFVFFIYLGVLFCRKIFCIATVFIVLIACENLLFIRSVVYINIAQNFTTLHGTTFPKILTKWRKYLQTLADNFIKQFVKDHFVENFVVDLKNFFDIYLKLVTLLIMNFPPWAEKLLCHPSPLLRHRLRQNCFSTFAFCAWILWNLLFWSLESEE